MLVMAVKADHLLEWKPQNRSCHIFWTARFNARQRGYGGCRSYQGPLRV